jgi:hypothetical protein
MTAILLTYPSLPMMHVCPGQQPLTRISMLLTQPYMCYEFHKRCLVCCFAFCVERRIFLQNFCEHKVMFHIMNFMFMFC